MSREAEKHLIARLQNEGIVFAEEETRLLAAEAGSVEELMDLAEKRISGVPLEYVLGFAEFCGLRIAVEPGVFIPRPRTEFLVQQAKGLVGPGEYTVVDLCCGSGAVGAAIAAGVETLSLHAVDMDPLAVRCAFRNLENLGGRVYQGNLYDALPSALKGKVNIIAANAPYVPTESVQFLPREARLYEPKWTLDGGADGLDIHRRIAEEAGDWLAPGGHLLVEVSGAQAAATSGLFRAAGLHGGIAKDRERDATVVIGTKLR